MPTYILLNGPPSSGKDTAAGILQSTLYDNSFGGKEVYSTIDKLSAPIKRAFAGLMNKTMSEDFCVASYESKKEATIPILGVSYRSWQIKFSEEFMKPEFGQDIFSRLLLDKHEGFNNDIVIVSDCGFQHEYNYLSERARCYLIRLYRKGCDFANDSREYIIGEPVSEIYNDKSKDRLADQLRLILTTRILPYHKS